MTNIQIAISRSQIQQHYYKYKAINDYSEDMLTTGMVYFNKADEFNDPYELQLEDSGSYTKTDVINFFMNNKANKMSLTDATNLANSICAQYPNIGDLAKTELEKTKQHRRDIAGIFCVAKSYKNLLMWAHYADSHKGFALEIDVSKLDDKFFPYKVDYTQNIPKMEYLKNSSDFIKKWALTKSDHWEYEEERRMIISDCSKIRKFQFPKDSFTKVFWGINVDRNKRDSIICKMKANGFNTQFYQEKLNQQNYQIIFDPIP